MVSDCFAFDGADGHGEQCEYKDDCGSILCTYRAKWHINHGDGCANVCGVHKNTALRTYSKVTVRALGRFPMQRPAPIVQPADALPLWTVAAEVAQVVSLHVRAATEKAAVAAAKHTVGETDKVLPRPWLGERRIVRVIHTRKGAE